MSVCTVAQSATAFAAANVHYVSPTGTATWVNATSSSTPCSLETALANYTAGDVLNLAAGTYSSRYVFSRSGTSEAHVTVSGNTGVIFSQGFIVNGSYLDFSEIEITETDGTALGAWNKGRLQVSGSHDTFDEVYVHDIHYYNSGICLSGTYNTVTNYHVEKCTWDWTDSRGLASMLTFTGSYNTASHGTLEHYTMSQAVCMMGNHNTVDSTIIQYNDLAGYEAYRTSNGDGFTVLGTNMTIRGCTVSKIWPYWSVIDNTVAHCDGIQFGWGTPASGQNVDGLLVENCTFGTFQPGGESALDTPDTNPGPSQLFMFSNAGGGNNTVTFRNNLLLGQKWFSFNVNTIGGAGSSLTLNVYNNTFWCKPPRVEGTTGQATFKWKFRNNIFKEDIYKSTTNNNYTFDSDYNLFVTTAPVGEGTHSISADPQLSNADVSSVTDYGLLANFRPTITSPAMGRADPAYAPLTDRTGATRDTAPDIGAYEYLPASADTTPPTVTITSPLSGETVSGSSVAISASASDNIGVSKVEFRVDGTLLEVDTVAPHGTTWNASAATPATHTITAIAYDNASNSANASATVTVPADNTPPAPVTELSAAWTGSVTLYWTNPIDADFAGVRLFRSTSNFADSATNTVSQTVLYDGTANTYHDTAAPNSTIYYSVFARDTSGNWSSPTTFLLPPVPCFTNYPTRSVYGLSWNGRVSVYGTLMLGDSSMTVPVGDVEVQRKYYGTSSIQTAPYSVSTDGNGRYWAWTRSVIRTYYRLHYKGSDTTPSAYTAWRYVSPSMHLSRPHVKKRVKRRKNFYVTGKVSRVPIASRKVTLYFYHKEKKRVRKKVHGTWRRVKVTRYRLRAKKSVWVGRGSSIASYEKRLKLKRKGRWYVQASVSDKYNNSKKSSKKYFNVK